MLAGLEDQFRKILDVGIETSTIRTDFNAIALAAGETRYHKGLTEIEGSLIEKTESTQSITTTMKFNICGS